MRERKPIDLTDSTLEVVMKLSEGNPGAVTAIGSLMKDDPMGILLALHLDDMGMRGEQIWAAFQYHCKGDVDAFKKAVKDRDKEMIATVNQRCPSKKAVSGGASFA